MTTCTAGLARRVVYLAHRAPQIYALRVATKSSQLIFSCRTLACRAAFYPPLG